MPIELTKISRLRPVARMASMMANEDLRHGDPLKATASPFQRTLEKNSSGPVQYGESIVDFFACFWIILAYFSISLPFLDLQGDDWNEALSAGPTA